MTSSLQEIDIQTNAPQYGRCSKRFVLRVHNLNLSSFGGAQWKKGSPMLKAEKQGSNIFCAKTQLCIELLSEVGMSWMTRLAGKLLLSTVIVVFWSSLNANSAGSEEHLNHWHWQGHHDLPWSAKYGLQRRIPSEEGRSGYKLAIRAQLTDAVAWLRMQLLSGRQGRICRCPI